MIRAFVLLIAICLTPTIALAQWTNEPAGATRLLNCPMSAADCVGGITRGTWLDVYHNLTYFSPGDAPLSPPTVARASLIHPNTVGGGDLGWWDNQSDRGLYFGSYFKFTAGGVSLAGSTKIFALRALNNPGSSATSNGFFIISGSSNTSRQLVWANNTGGLNNSHICGGDGASITVKETDNNPTVTGVNSISFSNGTVTDDGGGDFKSSWGAADGVHPSNTYTGGASIAGKRLADLIMLVGG